MMVGVAWVEKTSAHSETSKLVSKEKGVKNEIGLDVPAPHSSHPTVTVVVVEREAHSELLTMIGPIALDDAAGLAMTLFGGISRVHLHRESIVLGGDVQRLPPGKQNKAHSHLPQYHVVATIREVHLPARRKV